MDQHYRATGLMRAIKNIEKVCESTFLIGQKECLVAKYVVEKTYRIVSATLALVEIADMRPQLRDEVERTALRLVSNVSQSVRSQTHRVAYLEHLLHVVALLEAGAYVGQVAQESVALVTDDLSSLAEYLTRIGWSRGRRFTDEDLIPLVAPAPESLEMVRSLPTYQRPGEGHSKDNTHPGAFDGSGHGVSLRMGRALVSDASTKRQQNDRKQEVQKDRRAVILGILQKKDSITVKDVSNVIRDCSEKTLQRELLALVTQGVLVKEGERRWSTYRIA